MLLKNFVRGIACFVGVFLLVPLMYISTAAVTVTEVAGVEVTCDSNGSISESGGTVTVKAAGSFTTQKSTVITIKNTSGSTATISFDISVSNHDSDKSTIDDLGGKFSQNLTAGQTVSYKLCSTRFSSNNTGVATLSNFSVITASTKYDVSLSYDTNNGSVTIDGTAVNPGTHEIDSAALKATAKNGATFLGWIDPSTGHVVTTENTYNVVATGDMNLEAVFVNSSSNAWFLSGGMYMFDDLNAAAEKAVGMANPTVVPMHDGILPAGDYTIPSGVTLLIPNDSVNTVYTSRPGGSKGYYVSPSIYRTLTMASGANITVNGAISIAGMQGSDMNYTNGNPCGPLGYINMNEGSKITVNSGANLYAWGYITGTGAVEILSGGTVYEDFQIADWRGGSVTKDMVGKSQGVFPLSQYYVQNIQVPVTLHAGAYEKVCGAVTITLIGLQHIEPIFIGNGGMFVLSSGTLTKDYDEATDRLICTVDGDLSLSNLTITLQTGLTSLSQITIDSADYTLPLNSNITLEIKSGSNVTVSQDIAVLPGSKVIIEEDANVVLGFGNSIYVYDADNWGKFCYYKSADHKYRPIYAVAGTRVDRSADLSKDAEVLLNGTFDGSVGTVYTTQEGANIHSTGNGKIILNTNSATETYQFSQVDTATDGDGYGAEKYVPVSIVSAMLKNENGSYVNTSKATYYYDHHYCCGDALHGTWAVEHTYDENGNCSCGGYAAVKIIPKIGNERFFSSLSAACEAFTTDDLYIQMLTGTTEPGFTIGKNIYLDLNGQDVKISEGKLTINNGYTLYGMDSTTDAYGLDVTSGTYTPGTITGTVTGTVSGHYSHTLGTGSARHYAAYKNGNTYSFHRFRFGMDSYTYYLSPEKEVLAITFSATYLGDANAQSAMVGFGMKVNDLDTGYVGKDHDGIDDVTGENGASGYVLKRTVTNLTSEDTGFNVNALLKLTDNTELESVGYVASVTVSGLGG